MSDIILKVENLSKLYRLGEVGTGTISHDLNRWWAKIRGKEDPYALVGQTNDRNKKAESDYVWSLKDITFEVRQGEVLGIIGRNGAGKSTLLKLISQITSPTTGSIKVKGRIASLLEVGTGMNPELTARENIYLNGAILGMTKKEIASKFDEIVDFSGCAMYVDTPVKRFSSGMRVRLGFAVAAFLEPEILIVDEVLAVGDAEFQKKAIGKMKEVSEGGGRTVLFVSHNMTAVKDLCQTGILLRNGEIAYQGSAVKTIVEYQRDYNMSSAYQAASFEAATGNDNIRILGFSAKPIHGDLIDIDSGIRVNLHFYNNLPDINLDTTFELRNTEELILFHVGKQISQKKDSRKGFYTVEYDIPSGLLNTGSYYFKLIFGKDQSIALLNIDNLIGFEVANVKTGLKTHIYPGVTRPNFNYKVDFKE